MKQTKQIIMSNLQPIGQLYWLHLGWMNKSIHNWFVKTNHALLREARKYHWVSPPWIIGFFKYVQIIDVIYYGQSHPLQFIIVTSSPNAHKLSVGIHGMKLRSCPPNHTSSFELACLVLELNLLYLENKSCFSENNDRLDRKTNHNTCIHEYTSCHVCPYIYEHMTCLFLHVWTQYRWHTWSYISLSN